jgi:hypothetical protein
MLRARSYIKQMGYFHQTNFFLLDVLTFHYRVMARFINKRKYTSTYRNSVMNVSKTQMKHFIISIFNIINGLQAKVAKKLLAIYNKANHLI